MRVWTSIDKLSSVKQPTLSGWKSRAVYSESAMHSIYMQEYVEPIFAFYPVARMARTWTNQGTSTKSLMISCDQLRQRERTSSLSVQW
jgi:hypothetical protein